MTEALILKNADLLTMEDGAQVRCGDLWIADGKIKKIVWRDQETEGNKTLEPSEKAVLKQNKVLETFKSVGSEGQESDQRTAAEQLHAAQVKIFDCTGCTIMPGMIDSHVHYDESYMGDFFLASGITSVRNMRGFAGHAKWRDEILAGTRRGPYIYSTGPLFDGEDPTIPNNQNVIVSTTEDVEAGIQYTKQYQFPWVKTYPSIEPELYRYLMRRCREEGLPVCGHMTKKMEAAELADLGYSCCEHTSSLPSDPEKIRYLAQSGMWFCPTHVVCETLPDYVWNGKQLKDLPHYEELPEYVRTAWEESNRVIIENYRKLNVHPDFQTIIDRAVTFLTYSNKVMAGTDCAYPGIIPGFALADELEKLVDVYGMTRYDALCAATRNPAEHMGILEQKGRIAEQLDADLIVLEANPLENVGNVRSIRYVLQGTNIWDKEECRKMLKAVGRLKMEDVEFITDMNGNRLE